MTNFMFIVLVTIVVILVVIFLNSSFGKQLRVKLKGRTDEVMRQDASTPEGAKDYYNAAIVLVLGNINSNKVHGHRNIPPELVFRH